MNTDTLLEAKPKFIRFVRVFPALAWAFVAPYFGGFIFYITCYEGLKFTHALSTYYTVLLCILSYILTVIFCMFFNKKNYEATNYKVYNDRIEFEEGFINHKYTIIKLADVKEIHLSQNFIQRQAKVGTIRFVTAANVQVNSPTASGVCFRDIENSMAVYAKIKQIHSDI